MLWKDIRKLAISSVLTGAMVISAHASFADGMDEDDYPSASVNSTAIGEIGTNHQSRMRAIEKEYKKKQMPYSPDQVRLRIIEADLKEARMVRRDELEEHLMASKLALSKIELERINPYVLKTKARNRFFRNKNKNK